MPGALTLLGPIAALVDGALKEPAGMDGCGACLGGAAVPPEPLRFLINSRRLPGGGVFEVRAASRALSAASSKAFCSSRSYRNYNDGPLQENTLRLEGNTSCDVLRLTQSYLLASSNKRKPEPTQQKYPVLTYLLPDLEIPLNFVMVQRKRRAFFPDNIREQLHFLSVCASYSLHVSLVCLLLALQ